MNTRTQGQMYCTVLGNERSLIFKAPNPGEGHKNDFGPHVFKNCDDLLWNNITEEDNSGYPDLLAGSVAPPPNNSLSFRAPKM